MSKKNRIDWIDWAKLIGMFLVVLGHCMPNHAIYIYSFHMPLFFALSGLTYKPRPIKEEIKLSAKRLLIPYCTFFAIFYLPWIAHAFATHTERLEPTPIEGLLVKPLLGLLYGVGFDTSYTACVDAPTWFLFALFSVRIVSSAFYSFGQVHQPTQKVLANSILIIGCATIAWALKEVVNITLPFSLRAALMALPFFLGAFILKREVIGLGTRCVNFRYATSIVLFTLLLFLSDLNGRVDICSSVYGASPLLFYLNATIGTIAFLLATSLISRPPKSIFALLALNITQSPSSEYTTL